MKDANVKGTDSAFNCSKKTSHEHWGGHRDDKYPSDLYTTIKVLLKVSFMENYNYVLRQILS